VREADEIDVAWQTRQRDFGPIKMSYDIEKTVGHSQPEMSGCDKEHN
jgi:hypothetical protein